MSACLYNGWIIYCVAVYLDVLPWKQLLYLYNNLCLVNRRTTLTLQVLTFVTSIIYWVLLFHYIMRSVCSVYAELQIYARFIMFAASRWQPLINISKKSCTESLMRQCFENGVYSTILVLYEHKCWTLLSLFSVEGYWQRAKANTKVTSLPLQYFHS